MKLLFKLYLVCIFCNSISCLFEEFSGPFYARLKSVSSCGYKVTENIKVTTQLNRINRSLLVIKVNVTYPHDMDDDLKCRQVLTVKGINGNTWNPVLDTTWKCCEFEKKFAYHLLTSNFNASGVSYECPPKKGTILFQYHFREPYCNPFENIPVILYGDYKLESSYYIKSKTGFVRDTCRRAYLEFRPVYETNGICH